MTCIKCVENFADNDRVIVDADHTYHEKCLPRVEDPRVMQALEDAKENDHTSRDLPKMTINLKNHRKETFMDELLH